MKRILLITLIICSGTILFAQQNLFVAQELQSAIVHDDNTVTFNFKAPDARRVQIAGDFSSKAEGEHIGGMVGAGLIDMTKGADGIWTYTTQPLPSELYSYEFLVDGIPTIDPNNVYVYRDFATISNVFLVGNGQADLYRVNRVPHGTLSHRWYHSEATESDRRINVYTPAGYEQSADRRYPVLYLLHGMGGDEDEWVTFGRATQILDNLIAQGRAVPMILVMPNGHTSMEAAPGESSLSYYKPFHATEGTMDGTFESHFPEIIRFIEDNYCVQADKAHRAIAGLSMGGFHAACISMNHPDLFDYVGLFSAALGVLNETQKQSPVYQETDQKLAAQFLAAPKLYWTAIGRDDFLYKNNEAFRADLDRKGYQYEYMESAGGHVWTCWRLYLSIFATKLFNHSN